MTKNMKRMICYAFFLLICIGCETEDQFATELPPITTTGENTFGCLMNGEVYVPVVNRITLGLPIELTFPEAPNYQLLIKTTRRSRETKFKDASLSFGLQNVNRIGTYELNSSTASFKGDHYTQSDWYNDNFDNCGELMGSLEITRLDTINQIISGTFELKLIKTDQPHEECLVITEGQFDLKQ